MKPAMNQFANPMLFERGSQDDAGDIDQAALQSLGFSVAEAPASALPSGPTAEAGREASTQGSASHASAVRDDESELSRFRQLLFGEVLAEYGERIKSLETRQTDELSRLSSEQRDRFDQLEDLLRGELGRLGLAQRRDREERGLAIQQLSDQLETLSTELMKTLGARIDQVREGLLREAREREAALAAEAAELRAAFDGRVAALEQELQQERDRLREAQRDRDELSRLFAEVSQRLDRQSQLPRP